MTEDRDLRAQILDKELARAAIEQSRQDLGKSILNQQAELKTLDAQFSKLQTEHQVLRNRLACENLELESWYKIKIDTTTCYLFLPKEILPNNDFGVRGIKLRIAIWDRTFGQTKQITIEEVDGTKKEKTILLESIHEAIRYDFEGCSFYHPCDLEPISRLGTLVTVGNFTDAYEVYDPKANGGFTDTIIRIDGVLYRLKRGFYPH